MGSRPSARDERELLPWPEPVALPDRPEDAHKGDFGRVTLLAGSRTFTGAAYLTSAASLRGGAGQARLVVGSSIHPILAVKCTEVEVASVPDDGSGSLGQAGLAETLEHFSWGTAGVIGPGLGRNPSTWQLVLALLSGVRLPTVVDADGLNALADERDLLQRLGDNGRTRILTPHPGEMARLVQRSTAEVQANRLDVTATAARRWGAVVVLKGAHTVVAAPGGALAVDPHAVPALASGGTGDVLAGLIGALLAQGTEPFAAAVTGVYVHAAAGRAAARGTSGLVASELLPAIPVVMQRLRERGAHAP